MAHLHRLIVALVLALVALVAWAEQCTQYQGHAAQSYSDWVSSPSAAAQGVVDAMQAAYHCDPNTDPKYCLTYSLYGPVTDTAFTVIAQSPACLAIGGYPNCGTSYTGVIMSRQGDYCINGCPAPDKEGPNYLVNGGTGATPALPGGGGSEAYFCDGATFSGDPAATGCSVLAQKEVGYQSDGTWQFHYSSKYTGAKCVTDVDGGGTSLGDTASTMGDKLSQPGSVVRDGIPGGCNGYEGEINGVLTCVPPSELTGVTSSVPKSSTTTTTNPDGTTTTQSTTTTQDATCVNGQCTVTTVTNTTVNGSTTTSTKTDSVPLSQYCADSANKSRPECKLSDGSESSFGGTCQTAFTCDGDAAQCAIARATNQANCALNPSDTGGEQAAYASAHAQSGGGSGLNNRNVDLSPGSFDQTDALGGGGVGLSDLTVTVMGQPQTLKLSLLNEWLSVLGQLLVGVAFIIAALIVGRG